MIFRSSTLALLAVIGFTACNVDNDGDGIAAHLDCDDNNDAISPEAPELCDGLDNDCNGIVDDDTTDAPTFYADFDGDGFGDPDATTTDCRYSEAAGGPDPEFEPFGYVTDNTDCNDQLSTVNTEADERCDGIDNDCDTEIDEDDAVDKATWYQDSDSDGFGDASSTVEACDQPTGYVADDTDCDDAADVSNPGAEEICDGDDNDCDGETDEDDAVDADAWYADTDLDTYGDPDTAVFACEQPDGFVADMTDCNDEADTAFPGGTEVCDGLDNDCDPGTSEDGTVSLNATTDVYETIQSAIDAAVDGDTVYVCAGEWFENLSIGENITLKSGTGPDDTAINGSDLGTVILVRTADTGTPTRFEGLTITGGATESFLAGGIDAQSSDSDLEVIDCVLSGNSGGYGAVFGPFEYSTTIDETEISDNEAEIIAGAIVFDGAVTNSRILNNTASDAVGGLYVGDGDVDLTGTSIISNYAPDLGGGMYIESGNVTGGTVLNNLSDGDGGGVYIDDEAASMTDTVVKGNRATDQGGGIYMEGGDLENVEVSGNNAPEGAGIAIRGDTTMLDVEISGNTASETGGGVYHIGGDVIIESCTIEGNSATAGGGWHLLDGVTLDVTTTDWGTEADGNDNDPDDLYSDSSETAYTTWGTGETFVCDEDGNCS